MIMAATAAHASPPEIQTPAPIIYLADNLDEQDRLGWCIDTVGRGFSDRLHAHSCKPVTRRHGDVLFRHNTVSGQIMSATYDGKCAELLGSATAGTRLGLLDCTGAADRQKFTYDAATGEFRVAASGDPNQNLCLAVAPTSRKAGPFMSRDLLLAPCDSTATKYKRWAIKADR